MAITPNVSVVSSLVGALLLVVGTILWINTRMFIARAQQVRGSVDHMKYRHSSDGSGYAPAFKFKTLKGESIEFASRTYSDPPEFKAGQDVDILYDPQNPQRARLNKGANLYFMPLLVAVLGIIFLAVGVALSMSN